jgi:hypothetical protein
VDAARRVATHDHLAGVARAALGTGHRLIGVARLRGGSKKGVYRLTFDDISTAIVYIWDDAENYWPAAHADDHADPFSHASGIELFQAASRHLDTLGIRTPRIHLADRSRSLYPADLAVVEDDAFLRIRFGEHYKWLSKGDLDEQRLAFYTLAMRLSLAAGPLRLLDGDFPDRNAMMRIAEHNLQQALAFLPTDDS